MKKIVLLIFFILLIIGLFLFFRDEQIPFNKEVWLSSKHCKPIKQASNRLPMIREVVQLIKDKSRNEILEALGEPEPESVLPNVKKDLVYCLGKSYGLTMNWLVIQLDEKGKFEKSEILKAD